jgi:hypothetical protein
VPDEVLLEDLAKLQTNLAKESLSYSEYGAIGGFNLILLQGVLEHGIWGLSLPGLM